MVRRFGLVAVAITAACTTSEAARPERSRAPVVTPAARPSTGAPTTPSLALAAASAPVPPAPPSVSTATHPWPHAEGERLDTRFRSPPPGFVRVAVAPGSFAAFLRSLPLQPEGAPVVDFRGIKLHDDGRHPNIVGVADLDVGTKDLQHCADAIIRLHAEWLYGRGDRDIAYRSVSGQTLSYSRHLAGERARVDGKGLVFERKAAPLKDQHAVFRSWLDDVFSWAGTASLERDGKKVASLADMVAGDFFVMSGTPFGHAVIVLDVARDERGRVAILLGQSYMPAQSFQILAQRGSPWFVIDSGDAFVDTPFWKPFPVSTLRRF